MTEQKTILTMLGGDSYAKKLATKIGGNEKQAVSYIQNCIQFLRADKKLLDEANRTPAICTKLLKLFFDFSGTRPRWGDEIIVTTYQSNKGVGLQVVETVKFYIRILGSVPDLTISKPEIVTIAEYESGNFVYKISTNNPSHDPVPVLDHTPDLLNRRLDGEKLNDLYCAYMRFTHKGKRDLLVVGRDAIEDSYKAAKSKNVWDQYKRAMVEKTVIRNAIKFLPIPYEIISEIDNAINNLEDEVEVVESTPTPIQPATPTDVSKETPPATGKKAGKNKAKAVPPSNTSAPAPAPVKAPVKDITDFVEEDYETPPDDSGAEGNNDFDGVGDNWEDDL